MGENLTVKQRKFAQEYLRSGNGTKAAIKTYNTKNPVVAASIAHENLRKPQIKGFIDEQALYAVKRMRALMAQSKNLSVAFQASRDLLDRAGYRPSLHPQPPASEFSHLTDEELEQKVLDFVMPIVEEVERLRSQGRAVKVN